MRYYDDEKHYDPENGDEFFFYKNHKRDKVWWVDYLDAIGNLAVSFDKKKIIHLFRDYPWELTMEQKRLFDKENPYWADFFKDRKILYLLTGKIQKVKIHSNQGGFGKIPLPDDEVEQHLSIIRDGRVFFSSYVYGNKPGRFQKNMTQNFKADSVKVQHILTRFEQYFSKDYVEYIFPDAGHWRAEIKNDSGEVFYFQGSLGVTESEDLSDLVRNEFNMPNLYVFGGNNKQNNKSRETN